MVFNSYGDAIDYLQHHGFTPMGEQWVYHKANDRSGWLDKLDPITSRKIEGKLQDFGVRPLPTARMR